MNTKEYQYHHELDSHSVVCKVPPKEYFIEQLVRQAQQLTPITVPINIGITFKHPKDQFCYKVGREMALNNIKPRQCTLQHIQYVDNELKVSFKFFDEMNNKWFIAFSLCDRRFTPYLIFAEYIYQQQ
jgi:hypothetical protein